jgi:hypothetical protein
MSGLSTAHAPALDLPARFMLLGVAIFGILAAAAAWTMPLLLTSFAAPHLLAFVHANTVGVIGALAIGASYQLTPIVTEQPLASERLGRLSFWAYLVGLLAFVTGLATEWLPVLATGGALLGLAFGLYIGVIAATLYQAPRRDVGAWHIAVALVNLSAAVGLGVALACNKAFGFLGDQTLALLATHATLMLGGWVLVLISGVAYRLVGMFTLAEDILWRPAAWAGLALTATGPWLLGARWLLFHNRWWGVAGALALSGGSLLLVAQLVHLYRRRRRRGFDLHIPFALSAASLAAVSALLLLLGQLLDAPIASALWIAAGWLAIAGMAETAIQGFFYKIATFLVWLQRYAPLAGRERVPRLEELYSPRLALAGWGWWLLGLLGATAAIAAHSLLLARAAGAAQTIGLACFLWNVLLIGGHWRARTIPPRPAALRVNRERSPR